MPSIVTGDFSEYPQPIKEVFPYIYGEVCEARSNWEIYQHFFMSNEDRTCQLGEYLGPVIGMFQYQTEENLIFSIRRLLDRDTRGQRNLSFWTLLEGCSSLDAKFSSKLKNDIELLDRTTSALKAHRHKRIAHYDLDVSLERAVLPTVLLSDISKAIELMESIVNLVSEYVSKTSIYFDVLGHRDFTGKTEVTVAKAAAYDALEAEGTIAKRLWRKYIK